RAALIVQFPFWKMEPASSPCAGRPDVPSPRRERREDEYWKKKCRPRPHNAGRRSADAPNKRRGVGRFRYSLLASRSRIQRDVKTGSSPKDLASSLTARALFKFTFALTSLRSHLTTSAAAI